MLNRPYAFLQWVQKATVPERYVLMSEPDHLWLKPLNNIMRGERPVAFPFFYIEPWKQEFLPITRKHLGPISKQHAEEIAPIGMLLDRPSQQIYHSSMAQIFAEVTRSDDNLVIKICNRKHEQ